MRTPSDLTLDAGYQALVKLYSRPGSPVKLKLKKPLDGTKVFYGDIVKCENGIRYIAGCAPFKLEDIAEARLHYSDQDIFIKK